MEVLTAGAGFCLGITRAYRRINERALDEAPFSVAHQNAGDEFDTLTRIERREPQLLAEYLGLSRLAVARDLSKLGQGDRLVLGFHGLKQDTKASLEARGVRFLGPASGDQACGETGPGRMLEPNEIAAALLEHLDPTRARALKGLKVVVTAGPTREPIDPVRYITNRSSGKMGFAVASAARDAGADVVLVTGPVALPTPAGVRRVDVETAEEMYKKVHDEIGGAHIFVGCAAVADYRPRETAEKKIKRSDLPAAVEKTVAAQSAGATIKGFNTDVHPGAVTCSQSDHRCHKSPAWLAKDPGGPIRVLGVTTVEN